MGRRTVVIGAASLLVLGVALTSALRDRSSDASAPGGLVPVTAEEYTDRTPTPFGDEPGSANTPPNGSPGLPANGSPGSRTGSRPGTRVGTPTEPNGSNSIIPTPGTPGNTPTPAPPGEPAPGAPNPSAAVASRTLSANERTVFGADVTGGGDTGQDQSGELELGMRFSTSSAGSAVGVFLYQSEWSNGQQIGTLWGPGGNSLARVTFSGETGERWKRANFSAPVSLTPGAQYTISYSVTDGSYWSITNRFDRETVNGPLRAPAAVNNGNGVFASRGSYPTETCQIQYCPTPLHYFVDIIFVAD